LSFRFIPGLLAFSYIAYITLNYFLTSKYPSPEEFHQSTTYGALFFLLYGLANIWSLHGINKSKSVLTPLDVKPADIVKDIPNFDPHKAESIDPRLENLSESARRLNFFDNRPDDRTDGD
jgi:hypothetical protein